MTCVGLAGVEVAAEDIEELGVALARLVKVILALTIVHPLPGVSASGNYQNKTKTKIKKFFSFPSHFKDYPSRLLHPIYCM